MEIKYIALMMLSLFLVGCGTEYIPIMPQPSNDGIMKFHNDTTPFLLHINATGVFYKVYAYNAVTSSQMLHNVNYSNSALRPVTAGTYLVSYYASISNGINDKLHFTIGVNGTRQIPSETHVKIGTGGDIATVTGFGYFKLGRNANVTLMAMNENAASDLSIYSTAVSIERLY